MRRILRVACALWWAVGPAAAPAWGADGQKGAKQEAQGGGQPSVPPLFMRGIHLEEFDERGRTTELWAGGAEYSKDGGELRLSDVRILAEPKEGERSRPFELTGDRGVYHVKAQSARVEGNVRIRSQEGYVLSTDSATLFQDKREIEGPGEVLLEGPEGMTEGVGLHVWMNEEKVLLRQTVRTLLRPSALQRAKEVLR